METGFKDANILNAEMAARYHEDGFVVARDMLSDGDVDRLDKAVIGAVRGHRYRDDGGPRYPEPAKYTLSGSIMAEPDLAFIVEHPAIVGSAEMLLERPAILTQYVAYLRSPGSSGTGGDYRGGHATAHYDYKPYRPVGSSLNWLFVIIPLVDYDEQRGPLSACPGSHKLTRVLDGEGRVRNVQEADPTKLTAPVDAQLRRGDVMFMHMFTWHEAKPNRSGHDRYGIYNKYAAIDAPPASGPFVYSDEAYAALSDTGRRLLPNHSNLPIGKACLVLENERRVLLAHDSNGTWSLPGGPAREENKIAGWDKGNVIDSLEAHIKEQLDVEVPWMTYIGDYPDCNELCRVYAYPVDTSLTTDALERAGARWFSAEEIADLDAAPIVSEAVSAWLKGSTLRGIGRSQARTDHG